MTQYKRIGIDTSKAVFTVHGVDQQDRPVLRINLRRPQLVSFFKKLPSTEIAMEACGSAHHWTRELTALGHEVRLIPPQYVKPYVKRGKNDRNDAEAICEAAGRMLVAGSLVIAGELTPTVYAVPALDPGRRSGDYLQPRAMPRVLRPGTGATHSRALDPTYRLIRCPTCPWNRRLHSGLSWSRSCRSRSLNRIRNSSPSLTTPNSCRNQSHRKNWRSFRRRNQNPSRYFRSFRRLSLAPWLARTLRRAGQRSC